MLVKYIQYNLIVLIKQDHKYNKVNLKNLLNQNYNYCNLNPKLNFIYIYDIHCGDLNIYDNFYQSHSNNKLINKHHIWGNHYKLNIHLFKFRHKHIDFEHLLSDPWCILHMLFHFYIVYNFNEWLKVNNIYFQYKSNQHHN